MIRISPSIRLSVGLVFITMSVLLFGNFIGLIPDKEQLAMKARRSTAESLAVQCTMSARSNNMTAVRETMDTLVELNPEVLSLGMRRTDGRYIARTSDHDTNWVTPSGEDSTYRHWQVPIYQGDKQWSTLEISFIAEESTVIMGYQIKPFNLLLIFFAIASFTGFILYMRKALRHLDPSSVMPNRVKYAFNALTEGIILLDQKEHIILANTAFARKLGCEPKALMGIKASKLNWIDPETKKPFEKLSWIDDLLQGKSRAGIPLYLNTEKKDVRTLMVNGSPILDDKGRSRGAILTFDDITELESKNIQLSDAMKTLEKSRYKLELQNQELEVLATRDPLTGCLNRRAFHKMADQYMLETSSKGVNLACIMTDIDLFKPINDTYGHSVGDQVITYFADIIKSEVRENDAVSRYGGEEFCLLLPNCDIEKVTAIAERIRIKMSEGAYAINDAPGISVSASFGISDSNFGAKSIEELVKQADRALYKAKETGRNRVVPWDNEMTFDFMEEVKAKS